MADGDDILLAALSGDRAAALRLRQRQRERLERLEGQRRSAIGNQQRTTMDVHPFLPTPRYGPHDAFVDRLLTDALSGDGCWIDSSFELNPSRLLPHETDSLYGALSTLREKTLLEEELRSKVAERDRLLRELRRQTEQQRLEASALLSQCATQELSHSTILHERR